MTNRAQRIINLMDIMSEDSFQNIHFTVPDVAEYFKGFFPG